MAAGTDLALNGGAGAGAGAGAAAAELGESQRSLLLLLPVLTSLLAVLQPPPEEDPASSELDAKAGAPASPDVARGSVATCSCWAWRDMPALGSGGGEWGPSSNALCSDGMSLPSVSVEMAVHTLESTEMRAPVASVRLRGGVNAT